MVRDKRPDEGSRTGGHPKVNEDGFPTSEPLRSGTNELPSIALTTRFLALCQECGSERLAVRIVAAGRSTGVSGLPQSNEWTEWSADEMRAAVEHLQRKLRM